MLVTLQAATHVKEHVKWLCDVGCEAVNALNLKFRFQDSTEHLKELLSEIGRVYAPALLANAKALQAGEASMATNIDGQPWEQPTFPYQAKCLQWINEEYQQLGSNGQGQIDAMFEGTGCEAMIVR